MPEDFENIEPTSEEEEEEEEEEEITLPLQEVHLLLKGTLADFASAIETIEIKQNILAGTAMSVLIDAIPVGNIVALQDLFRTLSEAPRTGMTPQELVDKLLTLSDVNLETFHKNLGQLQITYPGEAFEINLANALRLPNEAVGLIYKTYVGKLPGGTQTLPPLEGAENGVEIELKKTTHGGRIKELRTGLNITQAQLAQPEFSISYISAIERLQINPSLEALAVLAWRMTVGRELIVGSSNIKVRAAFRPGPYPYKRPQKDQKKKAGETEE